MADDAQTVKLNNVKLMVAEKGYDVCIVCTSDAQQSAFWEKQLNASKGTVVPKKSTAIAVDEDWDGGAGNFLGTLYAWRKACAKLKTQTGRDLAAELDAGASVGLFHTAGKGTRLAPMPSGENNNKPGVKLPVPGAASILECVIRQTGAYASSRKGRLSVFWGDQIFVPNISAEYKATHHADILCGLGPMPNEEEWARRGLDKYGLIAACADGSVAAMLEKVSHADATAQTKNLGGVEKVGPSLGSFSLSAAFLKALDAGFKSELDSKTGKLDSDPHLWMPMTLSKSAYSSLMIKKGLFDEASAGAHYERVAGIIGGFDAKSSGMTGMFGAVNVGLDFSWWDYGQLALYIRNSLLLTESSDEAKLMRSFFAIPEGSRTAASCCLGRCCLDLQSVVSSTRTLSGHISGSAIVGCAAKELKADGAVLVNCCAQRIVAGKGAVAYNIVRHHGQLVLADNEVRVGIFSPGSTPPYFEMSSRADVDGGQVFKEAVCGNYLNYQQVYDLNRGVDVTACYEAAAKAREHFCSTELGTAQAGGYKSDARYAPY